MAAFSRPAWLCHVQVGESDAVAVGAHTVAIVGVGVGLEQTGALVRRQVDEQLPVRKLHEAAAAQRLTGDLLDRQFDQFQDPQHVGAARAIHVAHRDRARRVQAGHLLGKERKLLVDRLGMVGIGAQPRQQRPIDQADDRHRQIAAQRRPLALSQIGQRREFAPVALRADKLRRAHPAFVVVEVGVLEEDFGDAAHRGRFPGPRRSTIAPVLSR